MRPVFALIAMVSMFFPTLAEAAEQGAKQYICEATSAVPGVGTFEIHRTVALRGAQVWETGTWTISENLPMIVASWDWSQREDRTIRGGRLRILHYFLPPLTGVRGRTRLVFRPCSEPIGCSISAPLLATGFIFDATSIHTYVRWDAILSVAREHGEVFLLVEDEGGRELWRRRIGLDLLQNAQKEADALGRKVDVMASDYTRACELEEIISLHSNRPSRDHD